MCFLLFTSLKISYLRLSSVLLRSPPTRQTLVYMMGLEHKPWYSRWSPMMVDGSQRISRCQADEWSSCPSSLSNRASPELCCEGLVLVETTCGDIKSQCLKWLNNRLIKAQESAVNVVTHSCNYTVCPEGGAIATLHIGINNIHHTTKVWARPGAKCSIPNQVSQRGECGCKTRRQECSH